MKLWPTIGEVQLWSGRAALLDEVLPDLERRAAEAQRMEVSRLMPGYREPFEVSALAAGRQAQGALGWWVQHGRLLDDAIAAWRESEAGQAAAECLADAQARAAGETDADTATRAMFAGQVREVEAQLQRGAAEAVQALRAEILARRVMRGLRLINRGREPKGVDDTIERAHAEVALDRWPGEVVHPGSGSPADVVPAPAARAAYLEACERSFAQFEELARQAGVAIGDELALAPAPPRAKPMMVSASGGGPGGFAAAVQTWNEREEAEERGRDAREREWLDEAEPEPAASASTATAGATLGERKKGTAE